MLLDFSETFWLSLKSQGISLTLPRNEVCIQNGAGSIIPQEKVECSCVLELQLFLGQAKHRILKIKVDSTPNAFLPELFDGGQRY